MSEETTNTQGNTEVSGVEEKVEDNTASNEETTSNEEVKTEEAAKEETKEGEKKEETKDEKEGEKKEETKTPETYEDFKVSEGTELNKEILGEFTSLAKELDLSQENAQKLIDLANKNKDAINEASIKYWNHTREGWVTEIKNDSDYGGDKFSETITRAQRTLKSFGNDNLVSFLEDSGFGDNPDVIRMLAKIDKSIGEDRSVEGKTGMTSEKSIADTIYPKKEQ